VAAAQRSLRERIGLGLLLVLAVPLMLVVVLIGMPARWIYGRWLKLRWERSWARQGKRVLLV
jgi:hypothetical protein